ncbi:MAG TPA: serine hydrolase domain-containing protein [Acidimicrobiales bacterium]|jgi:CubicO group peptidase (beta-lactamase class C family)
MAVLDDIAEWPVERAAAAVATAAGAVEKYGDLNWTIGIASVTKILVGFGALIALEEGSLELDMSAGPPGSTVRHLLSHASGLPFNGTKPITTPGKRRIYSNSGIEALGEVLAKTTGMPVADYLHEGVFVPLGMRSTSLRKSPAWGARSSVEDLVRFGQELLVPTLITAETLAEATSEQFPGLAGVVPGMGRYNPCPWGLSFELKGSKNPHWTAPENSPRTFGHFGGSGTFLWVDPEAALSCVVLTNRQFGKWAPPLWSALSSKVLEQQ